MEDTPVAIVTGGAQGLGAGICTAFLKRGYKVCVADVQEKKGQEFVAEKQEEYGRDKVIFSLCDVSKETDIDETFKMTLKSFGKVDVLMNNAGICREQVPKDVIDVNLTGVIYGCQAAIRYMGKSKGGKGGAVVNTGSIAAFYPLERAPAYTAAKHGVIGLTRSYGHPYHFEKEGILFAAICPSFTDTEMLRTGRSNILDPDPDAPLYPRLMSPEYVADGVLKILDDRINGSVLIITYENGYKYIGLHEDFQNFSVDFSVE